MFPAGNLSLSINHHLRRHTAKWQAASLAVRLVPRIWRFLATLRSPLYKQESKLIGGYNNGI